MVLVRKAVQYCSEHPIESVPCSDEGVQVAFSWLLHTAKQEAAHVESELPKAQSRARRRAPDEKALAIKERIAAKRAAAKAVRELEEATAAMSRLAVQGALSAAVARVVATAGSSADSTSPVSD